MIDDLILCVYTCSIENAKPGEYEKHGTNECYMINDEILEQGECQGLNFILLTISYYEEGLERFTLTPNV